MDCTFEGPRLGIFFFFFLLYLARVEQHCLEVLYFLGLWKEQAFVGFFFFFFMSVLIGISMLPSSLAPSLEYIRHKEKVRELTTLSFLEP